MMFDKLKKNIQSSSRDYLVLVSAVLGVLFVASLLAAQDPPTKTFKDTAVVTVVEVPVQVSRGNDPLRTLTKEDFELFDNGKKQEIIGFDLIDLSTTTTIHEDIPIAGRRHFLVLFDMYFSQPDSISRARAAITDLVLGELHPTDLVAVATYTRARGPVMVLGFTSDRNQIRYALATLGLEAPTNRIADPLGLVITGIDAELQTSTSGEARAAGIDDLIKENARDLGAIQGRVARDQMKNQVMALTSSMEVVAQMMTSIQGRKHVLFLSEGFDSSVLVGIQGETQEDRERLEELSRAVQDGQTWLVDSEERYGSGQAQSALNSLLEAFRRANCTIQSIDIGRLVAGRHNPNQAGLFVMAKDTGGELYTNYNDLGVAMSEMLERTSVTYVLAFQPTKLNYDGKYHRLKVQLKDQPRGVRLVHRPGYYPPKPYELQSPMERRLTSAEQILDERQSGVVGTAVLAAAIEIPGEKAYVPVIVEVDGESLVGESKGTTMVEIYAYALGPMGTVYDFFARRIGLDLDVAGAALRQKGFKYWGHLDLDPGEYRVRVLVRNEQTGASGVTAGQVRIPSAAEQEALLLPPLFPEPFDRWVWGREEEAEQRPGVQYPFQYNGEPFFPAAIPQIRGGQEIPVALMAYNLGAGELAVGCRVLDSGENEVPDGGRLSLTGVTPGSAGLSRLAATFKAGKLDPGDYILQVKVKNLDTELERISTIPLRVVEGS